MAASGLSPAALALKTEEGATSRGMRAASSSWKRQGNGFSSRSSKKELSLTDTMILA